MSTVTAAELRQLYLESDMTTTDIGHLFSVSATTVQNWLRRHHIPAKPRKKPAEPLKDRFDASYQVNEAGCWIWQKGFAGGRNGRYGMLRLPDGSSVSAHRLSYRLHHGEIAEGLCVCHRCDVMACVNPAHLFLGTVAENNLDRDLKGRTARKPSKLTPEQIAEIEASTELAKDIAPRFGVHWATIYRIRKAANANERARINLR